MVWDEIFRKGPFFMYVLFCENAESPCLGMLLKNITASGICNFLSLLHPP